MEFHKMNEVIKATEAKTQSAAVSSERCFSWHLLSDSSLASRVKRYPDYIPAGRVNRMLFK